MLCFIQQTREYLIGKLRKGETITGKQSADLIRRIKDHLPGCVQQVLIRADGEFLSWQSVEAAIKCSFQFIIANKSCTPVFDANGWYRPYKRRPIEYNSCMYKPHDWGIACRFVVMRIPKERRRSSCVPVQCLLFEDDLYTYRIFCTNLAGKTHKVIAEYDKRADVENLVGEAKREGLDAVPSAKFKNNYAFFQIVMLAYNIWRYMKIMAHISTVSDRSQVSGVKEQGLDGVQDHTIRIARLKLLFIAAKLVRDGNRDKIKYSIHDARTPAMMHFLNFLDVVRTKPKPWEGNSTWPQRFADGVV